jgi:predicted flap endonuclease-1-like 5' DNA nuclease
MSLLFRIVYAAHANGTHHKLALDALTRLRHPQADAWRRVFLKHAALYMEGSKDPDNKFKDFKNHVLHVRDDYWGGAPEKVQNWYQHMMAALQAQNWSEAVYAAGVLSHYYTDPIHPFHTGQTEAENNIHRAVEWSINRSYDALKQQGEATFSKLSVDVPEGDAWLREMTLNGAEMSNRSYERLIAHYDISRGVVDPPSGLDPIGRTIIAELLIYAAAGFARILDRALADCGQTPPEVSLTADTILAGLQIPMKALQKRLTNAADRALVQQMYDELKATGRVDKTLPEDDRMVRDLHAAEVLAPKAPDTAKARKVRLARLAAKPERARPVSAGQLAKPPAPAHGHADALRNAAPVAAALSTQVAAEQVPTDVEDEIVISDAVAIEALENAVLNAANDRTELVGDDVTPVEDVTARSKPDKVAAIEPIERASRDAERTPKTYLALDDDVEKAPSIGAKTARRLADVGVSTVADFLEEDADQLATMLGHRSLTGRVLREWQDQARLVLEVPGLRGTHAQLLVGAGYRQAQAIAQADAEDLCAAITKFATTRDGQSILRDGDPPDITKIKGWMDYAAQAVAA